MKYFWREIISHRAHWIELTLLMLVLTGLEYFLKIDALYFAVGYLLAKVAILREKIDRQEVDELEKTLIDISEGKYSRKPKS